MGRALWLNEPEGSHLGAHVSHIRLLDAEGSQDAGHSGGHSLAVGLCEGAQVGAQQLQDDRVAAGAGGRGRGRNRCRRGNRDGGGRRGGDPRRDGGWGWCPWRLQTIGIA